MVAIVMISRSGDRDHTNFRSAGDEVFDRTYKATSMK